jgi:hypothetical protein
MGWWSMLWAGPKVLEDRSKDISKLIDYTASGLDKLFFTDQEKANVSLQTMEMHLRLVEITMNESSIRSITRRILAWLIMGGFLFLIFFSAIVFKLSPEWAAFVFKCAGQTYELVLMVGFFYFGYYAVSSIVTKAKEK